MVPSWTRPADCSRISAAAALKGGDEDAADRKRGGEKKHKWNQTAEQSCRPLSLQPGYFNRMEERDAFRGLKDPKVTALPEMQCHILLQLSCFTQSL